MTAVRFVRRAGLCAAGAALAAGALALPCSARQEPVDEWDPWRVLLPIDQPGGAARIGEARPPEEELARQLPGKPGPDLTRTFAGKGGVPATWVELDDAAALGSVPELGAIDLAKLLPKGAAANDASAYLYSRIRANAPMTVAAKVGYDDAARLWLNGKLLAESTRPGSFEPLAETVTLELQAGDNHLFVKVTNTTGAWRFRLLPLAKKPLAGRAAAQEKVNHAIDRGCDYLVSQQLRDGSWGFDDARFPGGMTALAVYALLKSGVSPKHHAIQRGVAYLRARPTLHTYTAGCTLLALWALHDRENDEWMADIADELISWQMAGAWAYPDGDADMSNTQYAVLGLLAAARSGIKVPPKVWRDTINQTLHFQGRTGGVGYKLVDSVRPTGSMTAAAISVLAIARSQIYEGAKSGPGEAELEQALETAGRWLADHFTITGSPPNDLREKLDTYRGPYYLYGVERACTLLGLERLGGADWYWEGANWFLDIQGSKGDFPSSHGEGEPNTCFGLLFLGRATQALTGGASDRKDTLYQTDDDKSDVWLRASGDGKLALWLGGFSRRVLREYAWEAPESKGLHVAKVEYLVDGEVVGTVNGDASRAWNGDKYSLIHTFESAGVRRVRVRAHLMLEPETPGGDPGSTELDSEEVQVSVTEIAAPHLLAQTTLGTRNVIRSGESKATASTQASDSPAGHAIDGRESSAWTTAPDDKLPTLTLEFERPLRANQIALSPLGGKPDTLGEWDRATKVELRFNNKQDAPLALGLDGDETRVTVADLARQTGIRTLEIRIVERVQGKRYPGRVGFTEIGLMFASGKGK